MLKNRRVGRTVSGYEPGSGAVDPQRPYAALLFAPNTRFPDYISVQGSRVPVGQINYLPHSSRAEYDALETRVEKRFRSGFSMLSAYTLSRARSNAPQFRNAGGVNGSENSPPQNSHDLEAESGPAYYNARHRWVTSVTWALPFGPGMRYARDGALATALGGFRSRASGRCRAAFPSPPTCRATQPASAAAPGEF